MVNTLREHESRRLRLIYFKVSLSEENLQIEIEGGT